MQPKMRCKHDTMQACNLRQQFKHVAINKSGFRLKWEASATRQNSGQSCQSNGQSSMGAYTLIGPKLRHNEGVFYYHYPKPTWYELCNQKRSLNMLKSALKPNDMATLKAQTLRHAKYSFQSIKGAHLQSLKGMINASMLTCFGD